MISINEFYVFGHKSKNNWINICMYSIFFSNFALKGMKAPQKFTFCPAKLAMLYYNIHIPAVGKKPYS